MLVVPDVFELDDIMDEYVVDVVPANDTESVVDVLETYDLFAVDMFEVKDEVVAVVVPTLDKEDKVDVLRSLCCRVTLPAAVLLTLNVVYNPLVAKLAPLEELILESIPKSVERYIIE